MNTNIQNSEENKQLTTQNTISNSNNNTIDE